MFYYKRYNWRKNNKIELSFNFITDYDFSDEEKEKVISRINEKVNSVINKSIKKFKSKK